MMTKNETNISIPQNDNKMAVAFDLDDTLYPESAFAHSGFETVAEFLDDESNISKSEIFDFLWSEYESGVRGNNFDRLIKKFNLDVSTDRLVELYRTHNPDISLTSDAESCLKHIENRPTGIITDGRAAKQRGKLRALNLINRVDIVCISGEFGSDSWKPATDMFEAFLNAANRDPDEAVYVADNPAKDFEGPNELGMYSIWINNSWGEYSDEQPTNRGQPTTIINDMNNIYKIINKWESK